MIPVTQDIFRRLPVDATGRRNDLALPGRKQKLRHFAYVKGPFYADVLVSYSKVLSFMKNFPSAWKKARKIRRSPEILQWNFQQKLVPMKPVG